MAFTMALILAHSKTNKEILVETDVFDYLSAAIHSQHDKDLVLRPVAYLSKKHTPVEWNDKIYGKELLAIIPAFGEWTPELERAPHPFSVLSDHKNLEYLMSTKHLKRHQGRGSEYLARFNFTIT